MVAAVAEDDVTGGVLLAALLGAGVGLGVVLVGLGLAAPRADAAAPATGAAGIPGRWRRWRARQGRRATRRIVVCGAIGLVVGVLTRWPVAAILAACAAWALPALIGPDREHARRVRRIEAIATWTESLRDTLTAAAGLEQAIAAAATAPPAAISAEVTRLAERLSRGLRLPSALREFAADLDDPTGDLVVAALLLAAERHARHLAELLAALAAAARDQASLRMRVAASRARVRTSTRVITGVTLAMASGLLVFNRDYLHPYDTAVGQLVLAVVGVLFGAGLWWLAKIARPSEPDRVLAVVDPGTGEGPT